MGPEAWTGSKIGFMTLTHCPLCIGLALLSAIRTTAHLVMIAQLERRTAEKFEHPASVLGTVFQLWIWRRDDLLTVSREAVVTFCSPKGGSWSQWWFSPVEATRGLRTSPSLVLFIGGRSFKRSVYMWYGITSLWADRSANQKEPNINQIISVSVFKITGIEKLIDRTEYIVFILHKGVLCAKKE